MVKRIRNIFAATALSLMGVAVAVCGFSSVYADDWSEEYPGQVYLWNGDLSAAGWGSGAAVAPSTYEVNVDEEANTKTVEIHDASAFAYFAHQTSLPENNGFSGYTVNLNCDIDLGGDKNIWIPIGADSRAGSTTGGVSFKGVFDGKGHTVFNFGAKKFYDNIGYDSIVNGFFVRVSDTLTVPYNMALDSGSTYEYTYGLFGNLGNATIKNLNVVDVKIDLPAKEITASNGSKYTVITDCVGAIAGYSAGDLTLENCTVGSDSSDDYINHTLSTGGLVGRAYAGKMNGAPYGSIKAEIIGKDNNGNNVESAVLPEGAELGTVTVKNCVNYIDLGTDDVGDKRNGEVGDKRGGILGYLHAVGTAVIEDCENYGDLIGAYVGGAVSYIQPTMNWHRTFDGNDIDFTYTIKGFKNYGTVRGVFPDINSAYTSESVWVGGVFGRINDLITDYSKDYVQSGETVKYTSAYGGKKDLTFDGCVNYGDIIGENTVFHDKSPVDDTNTVQNAQYLGGILGYLGNNKNTNTVFINNFNYGDIKGYNGAVEINSNDNVYSSGLIGAINFNRDDEALVARISGGNVGAITGKGMLAGCVGAYANGRFDKCENIEYLVNAYKLSTASAANAMADGEVQQAVLRFADNTNTVVTGIDKDATGFDANEKFEIVIPDSVTEIGMAAFAGLKNLVNVSFGNYSKLETIGDFAFGDTGITDITLPDALKNIGMAAFADCNLLVSVTLPDSIVSVGNGAFGNLTNTVTVNMPDNAQTVYGEFVFDGNSYLVAKSRASYLKLKDLQSLNAYAADLTYAVTIEYDYLGDVIDTELRLYGKDYNTILQGNAWINAGSVLELGTSLTSGMNWYDDINATNIVQADFVSNALKSDTVGESIRVYSFDKGDKKVFFARNDLVYDGREYGMNELNPLLYSTSDKLTARMEASIVSYVDADGNVAAIPEKVGNAGRYSIKVVDRETREEYGTFDIDIARATVDLGDYTNVLSWKLVQVGSDKVNSELRNENGLTLYIYQRSDGTEFPSRTALSDSDRVALGVGDEYTTRFVRYSVVRYRNNFVSVGIGGGMIGEAFTVRYDNSNGSTEFATDIGVYTARANLSATANYMFELDGSVVDGAARGITINISQDGKSATVTKVWYIVDVGNWTVTSNGGEYFVSNRVFNDPDYAEAPRLMYGDVAASDYGSAADPVSLTLTLNGNSVGNLTFTRDLFTQYINNAMPAGEYRLHIYARSVESVDIDEDGVEQRIHHSEFDETITFTVYKLDMPTIISDRIDSVLKGYTFSYVYDGTAHYFYDDTRVTVESVLSDIVSVDRRGTVWANSRYDDMYGEFELTFNLSRMQSDEYYTAATMPIRPIEPDRYTVFYKVAAPNYYDSVEGKVRTEYYFEVINVMEIAVPVLRDKTFDGTIVTADINDNLVYTVTENNGGMHAGEYDVVLTLRQPDFYMWQGQTLDNKTESITVKFGVLAANNRWEIEPGVAFWVEGKYDEIENTVLGKPIFGTAVIVITDSKDNVVFDSSKGINDLKQLKAGTYRLSATVGASVDYDALSYSVFVNVFEKPGLPWWGILLIVLGALLIVAVIVLVLWKKGVFQILTGKLVLAIRTKATVDATIAAVRANKIAEASRASRAEAEARDKAEERAQARREALEAERAKSVDEKVAELEAKAQAEMERANQIVAKATAMQERAAAMKAPIESEEPKKSKKTKKAKTEAENPADADAEVKPETTAEAASVAEDTGTNPTEE